MSTTNLACGHILEPDEKIILISFSLYSKSPKAIPAVGDDFGRPYLALPHDSMVDYLCSAIQDDGAARLRVSASLPATEVVLALITL
ncbi:hypothetical protein KEM48_013107 [Puccinia striiformis f. sp. tritici PST-130]|nr:hypothetical protein KEM48_013107 [Puccinia striiformis f. sp. tritici PST-130]